MLREKIEVKVTERMFTVTLTETEAALLIQRLKFKETSIPDLTEPVWKSLERALGHEIKEPVDI